MNMFISRNAGFKRAQHRMVLSGIKNNAVNIKNNTHRNHNKTMEQYSKVKKELRGNLILLEVP